VGTSREKTNNNRRQNRMTQRRNAPHTRWNPEAEIIALPLVLAVARNDLDAQVTVCEQMSQHEPEDIVRELACIAVDFARLLGGSYDGAARVIEQRMQRILDDNEGQTN
jgi:hypothetical protein